MMEAEVRPSKYAVPEESSESESSESDTELMVTTRAKRVTAGNRYNAVVSEEQEQRDDEDDVAMLFAEIEGEDEEYHSGAGDDDEHMSSSDDDDQGPDAAADDLEGENELQKQAKVERAKKRKAEIAMTSIAQLKKRAKIDPTSLHRAAPKTSKRKERVSWIPVGDSSRARPSLRKQTILHRAETHAKLKENEKHRLKLKAIRDKREQERAAEAPKELTQEDRLLEAARVERRNAKSLNRWEAAEKLRAEEQAARLAALKDRKLAGAVVTWHSAKHLYYGLKEEKEYAEVSAEPKKRGRKSKAYLEQMAAEKLARENAALRLSASQAPLPATNTEILAPLEAAVSMPRVASAPESTIPNPTDGFLHGITEYASIQSDPTGQDQSVTSTRLQTSLPVGGSIAEGPGSQHVSPNTESEVLARCSPPIVEREIAGPRDSPKAAPADIIPAEPAHPTPETSSAQDESAKMRDRLVRSALLQGHNEGAPTALSTSNDHRVMTETVAVAESSGGEVTAHGTGVSAASREASAAQTVLSPATDTAGLHSGTPAAEPQAPLVGTAARQSDLDPPPPKIEVISTRNLVILDKMDEMPGKKKGEYTFFHHNRKTAKPNKHVCELCPVSGLPVRYRDPDSEIGYGNSLAFKKLQDIRKHQYVWSGMLGCYVGRTGIAARGVPEGFLG